MKNILLIIALLALAPLAARAQYGPGGSQSLSQHHATASAELEAAKRRTQTSTATSGPRFTPAQKASLRRAKERQQAQKAKNKAYDKEQKRDQALDNQILDKNTGTVRTMTKEEKAKKDKDMADAQNLLKRMKTQNNAQQ